MKFSSTARLCALTAVVVLAGLGACSNSDGPPAGPGPTVSPFKDLSEKEHVVDNLVLAYNRRNLAELDSLLDQSFTFYFSGADVADRGFPESWNRADEMVASGGILGGVAGPDSVVSLNVDIPYDTLQWNVDILIGPGGLEEQYATRVTYNCTFTTAGGVTYQATAMEADLTVRNTGTAASPHWRLVRWDDHGGGMVPAAGTRASATLETASWGRVKEHYNPQPKYGDLSEKVDVINNLMLSYLRRDPDRYAQILDGDPIFRFYFSDGDVANGLPAEGWSGAQDLAATTNLLDPLNPNPNRIVAIVLQVNTSNLVWVQVASGPPMNEIWYSVTTTYAFTFRTANDITYITAGAPLAQFVVRNVRTPQIPEWRLVRWRDLGSGYATAVASAAVEENTWGRVKSLYAN